MLNITVRHVLSLSRSGEVVSDREGLERNVQKERQARVKKPRKKGVGKMEEQQADEERSQAEVSKKACKRRQCERGDGDTFCRDFQPALGPGFH